MQSQTHVEQVGGNHYQGEYQHWDMVEEYRVSYLEANATKYLQRWEDKGGVQDLRKAISYLDKRIKLVEAEQDINSFISRGRAFSVPYMKMVRWFDSCSMKSSERTICAIVLNWDSVDDLNTAIGLIEQLIMADDSTKLNEEATSRYVSQ